MDDASFNRYFKQMKVAYPNPLGAIRALGLSLHSFHSLVFGRLKHEDHLIPDEKLRLMLKGISVNKFIVTLASRKHAKRVLKTLEIESCFSEVIVPGEEWDTPSKLGAYEIVRQRGNWEKREVCIIGDDIRMDLLEAQTVGYRCVLVSDRIETDVDCIKSIHELGNTLHKTNRKENTHD